jgi:hypothetical protein
VLARHDFVAVAFKKIVASPEHERATAQTLSLFPLRKKYPLCVRPRTREPQDRKNLPASVGNVGSARPLTQTTLIGSVADKPRASRVASATR